MKKRIIILAFIFFLSVPTLWMFLGLLNTGVSIVEYMRHSKGITQKEIEYLQEHGSIVYGADKNAPPLRFVDPVDNQYKGIVIDYINLLSVEIESTIEYRPLPWEEAIEALVNKETDICDMFSSQERRKNLIFSIPIYNLRGVFAYTDYAYESADDISSSTIAVQKGDYAEEYLKTNYTDINYIYTKDLGESVELLKEGKVDLIIGDEPVVFYFLQERSLEANIAETPVYEHPVMLALPKGEETLLNIINKGIYSLKTKNSMEKIQQKWFGISTPITEEKYYYGNRYFLGALLTLLIILTAYGIHFNNKELQLKVREKTDELLKKEKDIFQAQKMAAIGQLAAGISHEMRNPIGVIRNYTYLMKLNNDYETKTIKSIESIEKQLDKASGIIDELLSFSRNNDSVKTKINLKNYFDSLIESKSMDSLRNEKKDIEFNVSGDESIYIKAYEDVLDHIFNNILNNSMYAISKQGKIDIEFFLEEKEIFISIRDSGEGIDQEIIEDIFNPFYTTKPIGKGTGLGLYIVYSEILNMSGEINIESEKGVGTTVIVKLPVEDKYEGTV
ncbi:signal transduction histidine kinase/ABC-type amino acid transport substrate-binding protein [Acetoanaerobium pronyense]|uniref:histidine kinase n=1 Tax=Acetoanaerobium pronyense TaxID=1482736 RepID=A0ABS4KLK7_9FIRM|nr:transporter substrate-binding domain-containing protein [Acetoanaerobium pronyense]MBP2027499.1 signal transduction histidine kinase/ABC-type amino acid transport substrate-binding protein [Acetoanaerobium pronyense]